MSPSSFFPSGAPNGPQSLLRPGTTEKFALETFWLAPFKKTTPRRPLEQLEPLSVRLSQVGDQSADWVSPVVPTAPVVHQGPHAERFIVVGRWRGWVTEVLDDTFWGEIEDLKLAAPPHAVELPRSLISADDDDLLTLDAIFYWTIGYRQRSSGARVQEAAVRFRRAPRHEPWIGTEARRWAERVRKALSAEDEY